MQTLAIYITATLHNLMHILHSHNIYQTTPTLQSNMQTKCVNKSHVQLLSESYQSHTFVHNQLRTITNYSLSVSVFVSKVKEFHISDVQENCRCPLKIPQSFIRDIKHVARVKSTARQTQSSETQKIYFIFDKNFFIEGS